MEGGCEDVDELVNDRLNQRRTRPGDDRLAERNTDRRAQRQGLGLGVCVSGGVLGG